MPEESKLKTNDFSSLLDSYYSDRSDLDKQIVYIPHDKNICVRHVVFRVGRSMQNEKSVNFIALKKQYSVL